VSRVDDPVLIVGLNRELEYKSGMVVPFQRRVIEMPVAVGGNPATATAGERPAPGLIVGIRMSSAQDKRIFKLIGAAVTVAILLYIVAVSLSRQRVVFTAKDQTYLGLTARDDRTEVVVKLGEPATDHWKSEEGALQYEALDYPDRKLTVILMGADRNSVQYVGTMDKDWKPVHSVRLRSGGTTDSLLRELKRF
jgi:hypothetical protein